MQVFGIYWWALKYCICPELFKYCICDQKIRGGTHTLIVAYPSQYHPFLQKFSRAIFKANFSRALQMGYLSRDPQILYLGPRKSGGGGQTLSRALSLYMTTLLPYKIDFKYRIWRFPDKCLYLVLLEIRLIPLPRFSGSQIQDLRSSGQILKCCICDPEISGGDPHSNCSFPFPSNSNL